MPFKDPDQHRKYNQAYYARNKAKILARHKERGDEKRAYDHAWYMRNRDRLKAEQRAKYWADPEAARAHKKERREAQGDYYTKQREYSREYRLAQRDRLRAYDRRRNSVPERQAYQREYFDANHERIVFQQADARFRREHRSDDATWNAVVERGETR
jgi:hypothetical protein